MAKIMCRYFKLNGYYLVTNNRQEGKFDYSLMPVLPLHIDNNQSLKYYY